MNRPDIVCLCGSTRFKDEFIRQNFNHTMKGRIVLTVGFYHHAHEGFTVDPKDKIKLDILHLRKIELCDFVYVIDVDGYIGESTAREIEYARSLLKPIRYLSEERQ